MSTIVVQRSVAAAIVYDVLSHLPLGADAASLYDPRRAARAWVDGLLAAYRAAPSRLVVHAIGLLVDDIDALLPMLDPKRWPDDDAGRALATALGDAIAVERARVEAEFVADDAGFAKRRDEFVAHAVPVLATLRAALVETRGEPPVPLRILDCAALGPNGRACSKHGARIVAVSLRQPIEHALLQVLHEEIHPITDPLVLDADAVAHRDTRAGAPGHAAHLDLERAAIEVGEALVAARAPDLLPAYARWRSRLRL